MTVTGFFADEPCQRQLCDPNCRERQDCDRGAGDRSTGRDLARVQDFSGCSQFVVKLIGLSYAFLLGLAPSLSGGDHCSPAHRAWPQHFQSCEPWNKQDGRMNMAKKDSSQNDEPEWVNPSAGWRIFRFTGRQTRGTETSKYPEEEKTKVIP